MRRSPYLKLLFVFALIIFQSAATIMCGILAFSICHVYRSYCGHRWVPFFIVALLSAFSFLVFSNLAFFQSEVLQPFFQIINKPIDAANSFSGRFSFWADAAPLFQNNWTGYGFGAGEKYYLYDFLIRNEGWLQGEPIKHIHNMYLSIIIQQGYIGLILWGAVIAALLSRMKHLPEVMRPPAMFVLLLFLTNGISIELFSGEFNITNALLIAVVNIGVAHRSKKTDPETLAMLRNRNLALRKGNPLPQ